MVFANLPERVCYYEVATKNKLLIRKAACASFILTFRKSRKVGHPARVQVPAISVNVYEFEVV
jgi:hypothetical protein